MARVELESSSRPPISSSGGVSWLFSSGSLSSSGAFGGRIFISIPVLVLVAEIRAQDSLPQALRRFGWFRAGLVALWMLASAFRLTSFSELLPGHLQCLAMGLVAEVFARHSQ